MRTEPITLPTSRECPRKSPGCKLSKFHGLLIDAESYARRRLNEKVPTSDQEWDDIGRVKEMADRLLKDERALRDVLLRNGTECTKADEGCREV